MYKTEYVDEVKRYLLNKYFDKLRILISLPGKANKICGQWQVLCNLGGEKGKRDSIKDQIHLPSLLIQPLFPLH